MEYLGLYLFLAVCLLLMLGYPVAFTLAGTALAFATGGVLAGVFDIGFLSALPGRIFGTVNNTSLIAVPLFILMGTILEKSRVAEELLDSMARLKEWYQSKEYAPLIALRKAGAKTNVIAIEGV